MNRTLQTMLMITVGCFIYALGLNMFYIPHNLLSGGMSGVSIIIYYLSGISFGVSNIILNIPILLMAIRFLGHRYTLMSIFGTVMISVAVDSTAFLALRTHISDPILSAVFGGVLIGIGSGLMYRYDGNSGGLDVVAAIVKKYYSFEMGSIIFGFNVILMAISAYIFNLELAVLTLAGMYIQSVMTNKVVVGLNQRKTAFIISGRPDEIADAVIRNIGRGVTILHGQGAFTHQERRVVFVVINLTQIARLKEVITTIDPNAFIFITPTADVIGRGFTVPKTDNFPAEAHYYKDAEGHLVPHPDKTEPR